MRGRLLGDVGLLRVALEARLRLAATDPERALFERDVTESWLELAELGVSGAAGRVHASLRALFPRIDGSLLVGTVRRIDALTPPASPPRRVGLRPQSPAR